jgi:hypothetical protein
MLTMSKIFDALREAQKETAKARDLCATAGVVGLAQPRIAVAQSSPRSGFDSSLEMAHKTAPSAPSERRQQKRSQRRVPVRVRPSDPEKDEHFEEILTTQNASRVGIHVAMGRQTYREGMRLFITLPYLPSAPHLQNEYLGEIIRIDASKGPGEGIAVRLLGSMNLVTV